MFEAFARWRELEAITAATGLGIGGLALCAALIVWVPMLRQLAIAAAITVGCSYFSALYFMHIEHAAVKAEWDAANRQAAAERQARDAQIAKILAGEFPPQANDQVDDEERKVLAALAGSAGACRLGSDALRLRH